MPAKVDSTRVASVVAGGITRFEAAASDRRNTTATQRLAYRRAAERLRTVTTGATVEQLHQLAGFESDPLARQCLRDTVSQLSLTIPAAAGD